MVLVRRKDDEEDHGSGDEVKRKKKKKNIFEKGALEMQSPLGGSWRTRAHSLYRRQK
jgi:hypothetical protein